MNPKTRVLFLIPSLVAHGAERQLCELVKAMDPAHFEPHVAVFYDPEHVEGADLTPEVAALPHVVHHSLHKRPGTLGNLGMVPRLLGLVRKVRPQVVHGYMDGNLPALLAGRVLGIPVAWGIRRSNFDLGGMDGRSLGVLRWMVRLSRYVDLIIFNSEAGLESHRALGMTAPQMTVIPNGFDTSRFRPDPESGLAQRAEWGVPAGAPLVGIVARLYPVKGHETFLHAAARVAAAHPEARFICIGEGSRAYTLEMQRLAESLGLGNRVLWPGATHRMPAAYNALSLLALASHEEGFPNVLGEAMACGTPCVATRVGDSAILVGPTGRIVPSQDPEALADAICELLGEAPEARADRARACRERVLASYGTPGLARRTERALAGLSARLTHAALPAGGS